ncbi:MAG: BON domain-containing protein [Candidatus Rokubacteria bacterium]|nr:BON domain-containing protein [Candidatus Rokubacteria bacterium]
MTMLGLIGTAAASAAAMYMFDPQGGGRRRALVRDQLVHAAHKTTDAVDATSRDLTNRARGVVAEFRGRFDGGPVSDETLAERVRARIGAVVGHAGAIHAAVTDGRVLLTGPILREDVDRLLRRVRAVRGVQDVANALEVHDEPGNIPSLQGRPRTPRGGEVFELWQNNWSPTARATTGVVGLLLIAVGLRRFSAVGLSIAATGLGLLSRAATNTSFTSMARGADAGAWRSGTR